jgi:polyhydroxybutyrate depolymerase
MIPYRIALFFALCCVVATPHAAAQSNISASIQHGGVTRSFIVHLPPGFSTKVPSPLVMALHPASSSAAQFQSNSGWDAVADANRVAVVYPYGGNSVGTGGNFTWNGWEFTGAAPDDIGFLLTLIDHVHATYGTDACRTYMTGFSNGAMMTNSFVAAHAGKVAAIAPISGGWITAYGGSESDLTPSGPVPAWIWRGSNETFVTGVGANARSRTQQDQEQLAFWVGHNAATLVGTTSEVLNYGVPRTYVTSMYAGTAPVRFTEVQGTGHLYQPGAADLIWNRFFSQIVSGSGACAPCTADLDGSGTVDGADLGGLLSAWGPCSSCPADLDGNGTVDGADLGKLLASWATCP